MRLPATVLQGILARTALVLLRIYLGVVIGLRAWDVMQRDFLPLAPAAVSWGELIVGVALVVGCFTRFAAAVVLVLSINRLVAGAGAAGNLASSDAAFAAISIALLVGAAGRTAGFDAVLSRRWPRSPFW